MDATDLSTWRGHVAFPWQGRVCLKPSDDQVLLQIKDATGAATSTAFQQLPDEVKRNVLKQLKDSGASHR